MTSELVTAAMKPLAYRIILRHSPWRQISAAMWKHTAAAAAAAERGASRERYSFNGIF